MFVTTRYLRNIIKGVILSFVSFFLYCFFSNPVHGSEATGGKAEFYFPIFMEYFVKHACSDLK